MISFLPREMPCKTEALFKPAGSDKPNMPLEYWLAGVFRHKERLSGSCGNIGSLYIRQKPV